MSNQNERIEELENEIESLINKIKNVSDELNKLKTIKEENKGAITKDNCIDLCFAEVKEGSKYYWIDTDGEIYEGSIEEDSSPFTLGNFIMGNYYETKKEAELEVQYRKLYSKIKCYAKLKGYLLSKEQISNTCIEKFYFYYDVIEEAFKINFFYKGVGGLFKNLFFTKKGAIEIAEIFKDEILDYCNKKWGSDNEL